MSELKRVLALDDEPNMRRLLEISLRQAGYQPVAAGNGREALEILRQGGVDLVVSDLHMPVMDGLQLLQKMRDENIDIPVIIITAQGEISTAVTAMKLGAVDYILRPFDLSTLEVAITRALSLSRLRIENQFLRNEVNRELDTLIGSSAAMQRVHQAIKLVAPEKATAFIVGETGTGKELVAHAIHQLSPRKNALFIAVNCAAIPSEMLESELFGHERGAFTGAVKERIGKFELADGGTLFLDEITEMPIALQAKLLRALQEGVIERLGSNRSKAVDIRIITATNRNPLQAVREGKLREDLYYRLNVFQIALPPLRDRVGDIPLLISHFLKKRGVSIEDDALLALQSYAWPGNVRELENVIERAAIVCGGKPVGTQHLPADILQNAAPGTIQQPAGIPPVLTGSLPVAVEQLERKMIELALQQSKGNKSKASKLLDISERSLWYKLSRYKLEGTDGEAP